jgi:hypothetical protein
MLCKKLPFCILGPLKRVLLLLAEAAALLAYQGAAFAQTETLDLKGLAKRARPAVLLLVVSDGTGTETTTGTGFIIPAKEKLLPTTI